MPIVKVIEVIASSEKNFDEAIRNCITEVSKTVNNIDSVYIKDFKVHVKDNKPVSYGVICEVSFRVEDHKTGSQKDMAEQKSSNISGKKKEPIAEYK
jgi:hypothetical protein